MRKAIIIIPIVIGVSLVAAGTAIAVVAATRYQNGSNIAHVQKTHDIEQEFTSFSAELSTADYEIKTTTDGKARVECDEKEKLYHEVKVENNTLSVRLIDNRHWYEKWFNWDFRNMKVTVYVPAKAYENIDVKNSTGYVRIPSDVSFKKMNVKTSTGEMMIQSDVEESITLKASTGNISLEGLEAGSVKIDTSTGKIDFRNVTVNDNVETHCSTGHAYFTDTTFENLNTKVSTGDVRLTRSVAEKHIQIKTSTGDVRLDDADAETLDIETDTGYVKGTLLTPKMFEATSDTAKPKLPPVTSWSGGLCKIKTDTGDINISIK